MLDDLNHFKIVPGVTQLFSHLSYAIAEYVFPIVKLIGELVCRDTGKPIQRTRLKLNLDNHEVVAHITVGYHGVLSIQSRRGFDHLVT